MANVGTRDYADTLAAEDSPLAAARARAAEFGCDPVSAGTGAALAFLAAAVSARAVVEIGTGTGVSGLWLLRGMRPDGVLTSVDTETEHQRAARQSFAEAGITGGRARLINGAALDVLPRLTDGAYDIVFVDGPVQEYDEDLTEALRLLRVGGLVLFHQALGRGRIGDPAARDADTVALRDLARVIREHETLTSALLPVGEGLLAAVVQG